MTFCLYCSHNNQGRFEIKNVKPTAEGESSKVKVKVRVSGHGIFKVSSASLMEKIPPTAADQNDKEGDEKMSVDGKSVNEGDVPMETEPQTNENASPTAEEDSKSQSSNGEVIETLRKGRVTGTKFIVHKYVVC